MYAIDRAKSGVMPPGLVNFPLSRPILSSDCVCHGRLTSPLRADTGQCCLFVQRFSSYQVLMSLGMLRPSGV